MGPAARFFLAQFMEKDFVKNVETLISPILAGFGYELVDVQFIKDLGRWKLRIFIDQPGGVKVGDCAKASHAIEDIIEVEGHISHAYDLEVSSPGLSRPLKKKEDFEKFKGQVVKIEGKQPIDGRRNWKGELLGMSGEDVLVVVDGKTYSVPFNEILRAKLVFK